MEQFKALIIPLMAPTEPPPDGGEHPSHDLPLFPFVPIVIPPGGQWPGEPPTGGGGERPSIDLPLFPFNPIAGFDPIHGTWPEAPTPPDPNAPTPSHPINLPPSENGWWVEVYVPGIGWSWVAFSPGGKPPENTMPQPK